MPRELLDDYYEENYFPLEVENYYNYKNNMQKFTWKSELKSFAITFVAGFALVVYDQLDSFTLEAFRDGSYLGLVVAAVRAGFKGVLELFLALYYRK